MIIALSYLTYFIFSTIAPIQRRFIIARKNPDSNEQIRLAFEVMLILTLGSLVFQFFSPLYFAGSKINLFLLSLACGIFGMGSFIFNYTSQKHIDASITNIVVKIYTPIVIILSSIFLKEGLNNMQIIGTMLLLFAMFIISKKHHIGQFKFDKYLWRMLLGGISLGILLVAERALQKQTGLSASTMLSWGSQCFCLGLATLYFKSKHTYTQKDALSVGLFTLMSSSSYVVLVYNVGNLSLVSSITTFTVVTIFISATVFLKEREDLGRKIFGSIIAVVGLLFMK